MLNQKEFVEESFLVQLFYLRTLKEFALNIETSFITDSQDFKNEMKEIYSSFENYFKKVLNLTEGTGSKEALSYQIFVTPYTKDLETLTSQLFHIPIQIELTEEENNLQPGDVKNIDILEEELVTLHNETYQLASRFIQNGKEIYEALQKNTLFSYSFPTMFLFMLYTANLYLNDLDHLIEKVKQDPSTAIKEEVDYNEAMETIAVFIEKLVDPKEQEITKNANEFASLFRKRNMIYRETILTPNTQMKLSSEEYVLVEDFQQFLESCIVKLLNQSTYFIIEPIFLDNMLRQIHYFLYRLSKKPRS